MLDVCLLGTGGMMPLPYRWLTALMVRCSGSNLLIDCGEGTQIALKEKGWSPKPVDVICFTHYHADHISGLPGLLLTMGNAERTEPITMIGPKGLERVVTALRTIAPELPFPLEFIELTEPRQQLQIGPYVIDAYRVNHNVTCYGYSISIPRKGRFDVERARAQEIPVKLWSILQRGETVSMDGQTYYPHQVLGQPRRGITFVYATDTRPVPGIVRMGQDSDLMILEGMYGAEEKLPLAHKNCHMLFREAAQLARDAGTKRLLLTHFSTSIETPEEFLPNAQAVFPETTCATDGMTLTLRYPEEEK